MADYPGAHAAPLFIEPATDALRTPGRHAAGREDHLLAAIDTFTDDAAGRKAVQDILDRKAAAQ